MATAQRRKLALLFAFGVVATLTATVGMQMLHASRTYADYKTKLARRDTVALVPMTVNPSWIISGAPVFRVSVFGTSPDQSTRTGIWECVGPAKFEWHYSVDETIYILEGSVEIEYLGEKITLVAGNSTHFAAGTTAVWTVPERVKKTYAIYQVGLLSKIAKHLYMWVTT